MRRRLLPRMLLAFLCVLFVSLTYAQDRVVTGKVLDENGIPLFNATVDVQGAKLTTLTDMSGNFRISVPAKATALIISYVGMQTQTVSINNLSEINVRLVVGDSKMNEVVVVGYGSAKKANLTTAQTTVSAKDI